MRFTVTGACASVDWGGEVCPINILPLNSQRGNRGSNSHNIPLLLFLKNLRPARLRDVDAERIYSRAGARPWVG